MYSLTNYDVIDNNPREALAHTRGFAHHAIAIIACAMALERDDGKLLLFLPTSTKPHFDVTLIFNAKARLGCENKK